MAQRERKQFTISDPVTDTRTEIEAYSDRDSPVATFLIQRHQMIMVRSVALQVLNRLLCLIIAGFLVLANHPSQYQLLATTVVASLIAYLWTLEWRRLSNQLVAIEETLSRNCSEEWEDLYIKSRHFISDFSVDPTQRPLLRVIRNEPFLWLLAIVMLITIRLFIVISDPNIRLPIG